MEIIAITAATMIAAAKTNTTRSHSHPSAARSHCATYEFLTSVTTSVSCAYELEKGATSGGGPIGRSGGWDIGGPDFVSITQAAGLKAMNSAYSHAVTSAIAASRGRWVVFMDADGSHDPAQVGRLWAERQAADLVIASRYTRGGHTDNPAILIAMSLAVNVVFRVVLGLTCADVSNSFRLYRGDDLCALTLECENFDIVEEILVKLCFARPGYTVKEIPATFAQRRSGRTKRDLRAFAVSYVGTLRRLHALKREVERGR